MNFEIKNYTCKFVLINLIGLKSGMSVSNRSPAISNIRLPLVSDQACQSWMGLKLFMWVSNGSLIKISLSTRFTWTIVLCLPFPNNIRAQICVDQTIIQIPEYCLITHSALQYLTNKQTIQASMYFILLSIHACKKKCYILV